MTSISLSTIFANGVSGSSRWISLEWIVLIFQSLNLILIAPSMILIPPSRISFSVMTTCPFLALFRTFKSSRLRSFPFLLAWIKINGSPLWRNIFATSSPSCNSIALTPQAVFPIGLRSLLLKRSIQPCFVSIHMLFVSLTASTLRIFSLSASFMMTVGNFLNDNTSSLLIFLQLFWFVRNIRC